MKPFVTPRSWLQAVPQHGVWQFTYQTEEGLENWRLRRKISVDSLGWLFPEADAANQDAKPKNLRRHA